MQPTAATTGEQWMRQTERRVGALERRPAQVGDRFTNDGLLWSRATPAPVPYVRPTFTNDWVNYGQQYHDAGYFMTSSGIVALTGLVTGGTPGTTAFGLPAAYRPEKHTLWSALGNDASNAVRVTSAGAVMPASAWSSLAGIMYPAAGVATWTDVTTFVNGFSSYHVIDGGYPPLGYWRDSFGRVWWRGMLRRDAAITADVTAFSLPSDYAPSSPGGSVRFPGVCNSGFASLQIAGGGSTTSFVVKAGTGGTEWISPLRCTYVCQSFYPYSKAVLLRMSLGDWQNYGEAYPHASLYSFPDGIVLMSGMVGGGTVSSAARILNTPEGLSPDNSYGPLSPGADLYVTNMWNEVARTDITRAHPTGLVAPGSVMIAYTGSGTWRSLGGINYIVGS